jgi:hypothetical protein
MKNIIQRALPLDRKYFIIDKKYIPLEQSIGAYCCDNCGKLIANIATVKDEQNKVSNIGFDCLETILINNSLLSQSDILSYEATKKMIPKILRFSKVIKQAIEENKKFISKITGLRFEPQSYESDYYTFHWLYNGSISKGYNDNVKLKEMDYSFLVSTLKGIFPNLNIFLAA